MARRWRCVLTGLAMLSVQGCVQQTPLCERPEVLQEIGRVVRQWNIYNTIEERSASEAPTFVANAVACTAVMVTVVYDPTATGWEPQPFRELLRYDVQVSGNRFYTQVVPAEVVAKEVVPDRR